MSEAWGTFGRMWEISIQKVNKKRDKVREEAGERKSSRQTHLCVHQLIVNALVCPWGTVGTRHQWAAATAVAKQMSSLSSCSWSASFVLFSGHTLLVTSAFFHNQNFNNHHVWSRDGDVFCIMKSCAFLGPHNPLSSSES